MSTAAATRKRRWLVPEVVQTSAMDCGPATLKCFLEGFGISVSYGRLREACQTDVDGTSIDTVEAIANQLGMPVEQVMIPHDHVLLDSSHVLPAIVVVRRRAAETHFVVVWRRHGAWLQVMDPAIGRRWVRRAAFIQELFRHTQEVTATDWRNWAASADNLDPLHARLRQLGASAAKADSLSAVALTDDGWFSLAALDAATRLVQSMVDAKGISPGAQAVRLVEALFQRTSQNATDMFALIPHDYWSVAPDVENLDPRATMLVLQGAVLLRALAGVRVPTTSAPGANEDAAAVPLSPELRAALREKAVHPLRSVWELLKADGRLAPLALLGAMMVAAGAVLIETLLFRGLFDMAALLTQPAQRLAAVAALIAFAALLLSLQVPIFTETLRLGRHLEVRLRMALLRKLPRLTDRYFHSRPVSDMAERSHSIAMTRGLPATGMNLAQTLFELVLTLIGVALIDASSVWIALSIAASAVGLSLVAQPMLNERDLRVRNHAGALHSFYLDALLGLIPVRTHGAQRAVSRQHEGLLTEWARSARGLIAMSVASRAAQSLVCTGLAAYLLVDHFLRIGGVSGADLLLVYWALKLPSIGGTLSALALQYPGQRNVLTRLLEPLAAPEEAANAAPIVVSETPVRREPAIHHDAQSNGAGAVGFAIAGGSVVAAGHTILREVDLTVRPGEHVAIVGKSGAGKSTLLGLLLGWHRLTHGDLRIDGVALSAATLDELRRHTAWIDPAIQIWNSAFLDNLAYAAQDDGLARVGSTVEAARLRSALQKLPQGLQTHLGEGGGLLSGGEGQRVRLARALMQTDVRLALLDEPFRGMDRAQRVGLLTDARSWWHAATLLCVTHDVGETLNFDRVLVIEDGRIVEDDAPHRLAAGASRYRQLLDAETHLREQLWRDPAWRRLRLRDGRIEAAH